MRFRLPACCLLGLLALASPAAAHVTLNPEEAPADSFSRFAIRVPTERDVDTVEVRVQFPAGLFSVRFQPKPGWKREVKMEKLAKPTELFGQKITERVASVTWSGGKVGPGEFEEFGMSARIPNRPGRQLVFPAVQRYSNGEVVRWIGPPDAEEPAPRVAVTRSEEAEAARAGQEEDESSDGEGRANLALGFGIAGLLVGLAALAASRRNRSTGR